MNNSPAPPSQSALRRLLVLITAVVVVVIFSYGWTVTDIDLSVPQEPQRQQNVSNALRELLSPNVFTQDYEIKSATTPFLIDCPDDFISPEAPSTDEPYIVVEPACGSSGEQVTVRGYNFYESGLSRMNWIATDGERRIRQVDGRDNFVANGDGTFEVQVEVPRIRGTAGETHTIEAQGRFPIGLPRISDTTEEVLQKMTETIFLALIATSISILPSAVLSFFAAHNLMRPIRTQLGSLLVTLALLPVGWFIGTALLSKIGTFILELGRGDNGGSAAASLLIVVAMATTTRTLPGTKRNTSSFQPREMLNLVIVAVLLVVGIGFVGRIGIAIGDVFTEGIPGYVGTFAGAIGELIELLIVPIAGIVGVFTISSIGESLTRDVLKQASATLNHVLGGLLGAVAGAILMGIIGIIGMSAAWMGLLVPVIAGALGSALLPMLYRRYVVKTPILSQSDRWIMSLLSWVGVIVVFIITFTQLNVRQSLVEGVLPPKTVAFTVLDMVIYQYIVKSMLIGAVVGGLTAGLAGIHSNFPIGNVMYNITRTILNALRSIEPLIMGLVFVVWVGIGPFAGVLALTLHSIASLGKLYSEQIENIDTGPIEALQSTGANRLQTIMYAVVPQIIPPYIAFTMYRWDINVRMSTIIGFVGGGGIGFLLQQQINLLRYRDAGVAVLAIAIVVSILDYASAAIRERYT